MYGYSGSGKSRLAHRLAPHLPAVVVRSDLERKRLHGLDPRSSAAAAVGSGLYDAAATAQTYARLEAVARTALAAGWNIVVDAAFLESERREAFLQLGLDAGARPVLLQCEAPADVLRERVANRRDDPSDAGTEVLEAQLARRAETGPLESRYRVPVDTRDDPDLSVLVAALR
jgi:predicted kinase